MHAQRLRPTILMWLLLLAAVFAHLPTVRAVDNYDSLLAEIRAANHGGSGEISLSADVALTAPLPPITGSLTIDGGGHSISGKGAHRIFDVNGGALTLSNITLTGGKAIEGEGGAIRMRNGAEVTIESSTLSANSARHGGAIATFGPINRLVIIGSSIVQNRSVDSGGAIASQNSAISIQNSTIHANRASTQGGSFQIYNTDLTLTHVTITNNSVTHGEGDAIHAFGSRVFLRNSIVANRAPASDCAGGIEEAAGIFSQDGTCGAAAQGDPMLGEIVGSPAHLPPQDYSPIIDRADPGFCLDEDQRGQARPFGGGCDIGAIETTTAAAALAPIEPPPPCPLELRIVAANTDAAAGGCPAGDGHDVITLYEDIALTAPLPVVTSDITIEGNGHSISGEGKYRIFRVNAGKLTINNLTLTRAINSRSNGGAIGLEGTSRLEVNHARFIDNVAAEGGAIGSSYDNVRFTVNNSHFEGNVASFVGGAISMNGGGIGTIRNSSFVRNRSEIYGGAIYTVSGAVSVDNSTFISNRADKSGGALSVEAAPVTLTHLTIDPSGISLPDNSFATSSRLYLRNSIVNGGLSAKVCESMKQNIANLIKDGSCSPKLSGDPMLQEPADTSAWLEPLPGSPMIRAADPRLCPETDQIGRPRALVGPCDIGAIESIPVSRALADCAVITVHVLNFRAAPNGTKIGQVQQNRRLRTSARTPGWFQVDYEGATGWISADYVEAEGECG